MYIVGSKYNKGLKHEYSKSVKVSCVWRRRTLDFLKFTLLKNCISQQYKVCHWFTTVRWYAACTPLFKVALNTITLTLTPYI